MEFDFWNTWHSPMGVFTFVLAIILINGIFSWLKTRSQQETLREAIKAGVDLDPATLKDMSAKQNEDSPGGRVFVGLILLAVAGGLMFFGYQIGRADGDEQVFIVFQGIAAFPGLIGLVFLLSAPFAGRGKKRED